jgi:D-aspartate ligase
MSTPAIVLGGSGVCGLGVLRSLARAGVDVILLDTRRSEPAMLSRFGRKRIVSGLDGINLVKELLSLAAEFDGRALLFPTSDESVMTLSKFRQELSERYILKLPDHRCVEALVHKTSFQELAERHGFPVPRTIVVRSLDDLRNLREISLPCIVKPTIKTVDYVKKDFERAYKVLTVSQAEAICRNILPFVGSVVVQDWIPGSDCDLYFCLQYRSEDGSTLCSFAGRKMSVWPRDVGTTASCIAAPEAHAALCSLTEAFFTAVSFVGMGGMEYKRDARTGQFLMIEPTVGRVDAQEEVATLNGINIPLMVYNHETGARLPCVPAEARPAIWRNSFAHWRSVRSYNSKSNNGDLSWPSNASANDAYWRYNDPLPAAIHVLNSARWAGRKVLGRKGRMLQESTDVASSEQYRKKEFAQN